jgi:hypothetical protein
MSDEPPRSLVIAIFVPSGDQNTWPSLTRNEFVSRVPSLPSAFIT